MRAPVAKAVRPALLGLVASIAVLIPQPVNAATSTTHSVTFGSGSATMSKFFTGDGSSCLTSGNATYRYELVSITVSENSTVSYQDLFDTNDVGVGVFPSGGFSPSSPASGCIVSVDDSGSFTLTGPATYDFVVTAFSSTATGTAKFTLTMSAAADDASQSADQSHDAHPVVHQALPMPESGSCTEIQDADLAWGTGLSGGWRKSWGPWVRVAGAPERQGGWACIRTLKNMGGHTWVIAG